jgi:Ca2+-binding RTX toxin-like protein
MGVVFSGGTVAGVTNDLLNKYTFNGVNSPNVTASATQVDADGILIGGFGLPTGNTEISATLKGTNLNSVTSLPSLDPATLLGLIAANNITISEISASVEADKLVSLVFDPAVSAATFATVTPTTPLAEIQGLVFAGADSLTGTAFADSLVGFAGDDIIGGGDGNDTLLGGGGLDKIRGGGGVDVLHGGADKDVLHGGAGDDILNGGKGDDILAGGQGNDKFVFSSGVPFASADLGIDRISDFTVGNDRIVLDAATFVSLGSPLTATDFATVTNDADAGTSAAAIVYNSANGKLFYNEDRGAAGLGTGAQFAVLTGNPLLSASSFAVRGASM